MRNVLSVLIITLIVYSSCSKDIPPLTKKQMDAKIDSIVNSRLEDIKNQAMIDLEHRIAIEVKVKADSILQANTKKDTVAGKKKILHKDIKKDVFPTKALP